MADLRIGTCSWKYDSWRGIVYPRQGAFDHLAEYAKRFDTVEVDQWFWSLFAGDRPVLPRTADAARYAAAVPPGFRFTVKAPNSVTLTHHYRKEKTAPLVANPHFLSPDLLRDFLARLEPMREKIGAVMLQFEYLNRQKMASRERFLAALAPFLDAGAGGPPLAVESRNPNFLDAGFFRFLREHGAHPVLCQGYYLPPVWEVEARQGDSPGGLAVVRLMGGDRRAIEGESGERWDRVLQPKDGELAEIAPMVQRMRKRGQAVYVNINNHYEGSAPLTAEKLKALCARLD